MSKIAITGKGGVGKTTFAGLLAYILAERGQKVYAIDADPDATLASALGIAPERANALTPIVKMDELIFERTGARPGESGGIFRMNPRADDIPERFSLEHRGIHLLKMGTIRGAGAGCICPENAMVKSLVAYLLLGERETVIMDMVAGLEHMGRGTAGAVDVMVMVVEPGLRSLQTARAIDELAGQLGVPHRVVVANRVRGQNDLDFITEQLPGLTIAGWLPFSEAAIEADRTGQAVYDVAPELVERVREIADRLLQ